ncbi:MAG TPA: tyrosine--tRNA ligase [Candidatus Dormibacteraeota bacterium]|nr:tyrosine--tRNA ligase [Candidatus Dormibacteraeota bacterium]
MSAALWEWLRKRAVQIHVADHLCERLQRGDKLRVKLGLDPTAPDLHVGHLVQLDALRAFQDDGHTVVVIIGDYTAMIGDPSGQSETRPMLTREQVDANAKTYFDQLYKVLDPGRTEVHGNSEWLGEMGAADILRLLVTQTLQSVLQREDFAKRLRDGDPIGAHEMLYPFNQAYDSVAIQADVEIGGTDQLFNLLFGREVQRAYGQQPQDIAVFPLLEGLDGVQKMSKSLGNYIGITDPPEQIYGKTMSIPDPLTERYLRLVSDLQPAEIERVLALGPRDAKAALARRLVERLHGAGAAAAAEDDFDRRFRRRQLPEQLPEHTPRNPADLVGTLVELGWYPTRTAARRVVEQGGVRVNQQRVSLDHALADGDVLQAGGKRNAVRIRLG